MVCTPPRRVLEFLTMLDWQQRFWSNVDKSGECWLWTARRASGRYGQFRLCGKFLTAHRVSYEIHHGSIPTGLFVLHSCDNPLCVNPSHLRAGTAQENAQDREARGRHPHPRKQRVPKGPPPAKLTPEAVVEIRRCALLKESTNSIARRFKVSPKTVRNVLQGKLWRHVGNPA